MRASRERASGVPASCGAGPGAPSASAGGLTTRRFDLTALPDLALAELRRRRIGFVFQFYNRIPVLDAAENAALPLLLDGSRAAAAGCIPPAVVEPGKTAPPWPHGPPWTGTAGKLHRLLHQGKPLRFMG